MKIKVSKKKSIFVIVFFVIFFVMFPSLAFADSDGTRLGMAFSKFFTLYKFQLQLLMAFGITSSILAFIYNLTRLAVYHAAFNKKARELAITNLFISGTCTMALGTITTIISIVFHTAWGV